MTYWSSKDHGLAWDKEGALVPPDVVPFMDRDKMFFGKYKDQPLGEVPMKYWRWLMEKPDFMTRNPRLAAYIRQRLNLDENNKPKARKQT